MPLALQFNQVAKRYAKLEREAVRGVSFGVPVGAAFALAGVNGAGKSTLMKCLLDLTAADSGTIALFGVDSRRPEARRGLGFLPERFTPPFYLTARDYLRLYLDLTGTPQNQVVVGAMLEDLDLDPKALASPVRQLSKGMAQKLGLAAIFLSQPRLIVLDEPMSGLDPKARACVKRVLKRVHRAGATIFFTSHALADVEELCDALAVIDAGQLKFCGTPAALLAAQRTDSLEAAFLNVTE